MNIYMNNFQPQSLCTKMHIYSNVSPGKLPSFSNLSSHQVLRSPLLVLVKQQLGQLALLTTQFTHQFHPNLKPLFCFSYNQNSRPLYSPGFRLFNQQIFSTIVIISSLIMPPVTATNFIQKSINRDPSNSRTCIHHSHNRELN